MQTILFERFHRMEGLMHRLHQQSRRDHGPMGDPHRGQGRVLALLKLQPEISQKDLLYLLDMKPQSLGELLAKLEHKGFIIRNPSETDRRVMQIRLTEAGAKAAEKPYDSEDIFQCLSEEEQAVLCGYLDRIIEALEQSLDADDNTRPEDRPPVPPHERGFHHHAPHERPFCPRHPHGRGPAGGRRDRCKMAPEMAQKREEDVPNPSDQDEMS